MKLFSDNQRVMVRVLDDGQECNRTGTVKRRKMANQSAWIALDERGPSDWHPFPENDSRGTHVLAWPEDCDEVKP